MGTLRFVGLPWHPRLHGCEFEQTPGDEEEHRGAWHAAAPGITASRVKKRLQFRIAESGVHKRLNSSGQASFK